MARTAELRLITRVAQMYYVEGLKQSEISATLRISQATISRLLKRAEREGIVRITLNVPRGTFPDLETALREGYGLTEAIVAECGEDREESILSGIGDAAAHFLETTLAEGEVIGISSWSGTLLRMVDSLHPPRRVRAERVVQILGGMGSPDVQVHANHLTTRLAQVTDAQPQFLSVPGVAASAAARAALLADPYVAATLEQFPRVTLALVGIGSVEPSKMLEQSGNVFRPDELFGLADHGAVGDVCLRFFAGDGRPLRLPVDERVIGMTVDQLKAVPRVVGLAGGRRKVAAIRGALLGGLIDVLITDKFTAAKLLPAAAQQDTAASRREAQA